MTLTVRPDTINHLISEKDFLTTVIEYAQAHGWKVAHFRPGMTGRRVGRDGKPVWVTPVQGDGKGFPDLVLVRERVLIFAELKSQKGRVSKEQLGWLDAISPTCAGAYCWRPEDWNEIEWLLG